jgi:hypothetical protein
MAEKYEDPKRAELLQIVKEMEDDRRPYESDMQDILDYYLPRRVRFNLDGIDPTSQQMIRSMESYDSTAITSLRQFSDAIHGYMMSKSFAWFSLALMPRKLEENYNVRKWIQECKEAMYAELQMSNFYDASIEALDDGGSIGTGFMFVGNDPKKNLCYFSARHPGEMYIAENMYGIVDTVCRKFWLTTKQAIEQFGDKMGEDFLEANKGNMLKKHKFLHIVLPNGDYMKGQFNTGDYPFASFYLSESCGHIVDTGGYESNPYIVWRFRKNSNEVWGRSLAWDCLSDVKRLNLMVKQNLTSAQLAVNPPLQVPAEMMAAPDWIKPRAIIPYQSENRLIQPVRMGGEAFQIAKAEEEMVRQNVRQGMMTDFFLMMNSQLGRNLTATQVLEMSGEKSAVLGAIVGRIESEFLDPVLARVFELMAAEGRLPPPPPSLKDLKLDQISKDYVGPLAQNQRRFHSGNTTMQTVAQLLEIAKINQDALDWFDVDVHAKKLLIDGGMPADAIREDVDVKKMRQQRAQAQQQAMAMQMQQVAMQSSNKLAKAPEEGSPLESMVGQGGL